MATNKEEFFKESSKVTNRLEEMQDTIDTLIDNRFSPSKELMKILEKVTDPIHLERTPTVRMVKLDSKRAKNMSPTEVFKHLETINNQLSISKLQATNKRRNKKCSTTNFTPTYEDQPIQQIKFKVSDFKQL